jgi:hypothetical protein
MEPRLSKNEANERPKRGKHPLVIPESFCEGCARLPLGPCDFRDSNVIATDREKVEHVGDSTFRGMKPYVIFTHKCVCRA